jgi:hypothetical protein
MELAQSAESPEGFLSQDFFLELPAGLLFSFSPGTSGPTAKFLDRALSATTPASKAAS